MQGPSAAAMSRRLAPSRAIAATVASTTPVSAPFQPACAAPINARLRIGEQDHAAVGAGDAERESGRRGHDAVAARPASAAPMARRLRPRPAEWT